MANKREASGFVGVSPKRTYKGGVIKFDVTLQDGEDSLVNITGFGEESHSQLKQFSDSKSPVRVQLFPPSPGYSREVINQRSLIREAMFHDVPFQYSPNLFASASSSIGSSTSTDIKTIESSPFCKLAYYTISGKLAFGSKDAKLTNIGKKVKEDVTIFDKTGNMRLSVWEPLITDLKENKMVEMMHLRLRTYNGQITLTTTPETKMKEIDDDEAVQIPADFQLKDKDEETLKVVEIESVGKFNKFSSCSICRHKVAENAIRNKSFDCSYCKQTYRTRKLTSNYMVPVKVDGVEYVLPNNVITSTLGDVDKDDDIRDNLLDLENVTFKYNKNTRIVSLIEKK